MGEFSRKEFFQRNGASGPRTRATSTQVIDGKVSQGDDAVFIREETAFIDQDSTTRKTVVYYSRLCNCGGLIGQKNPLQGQCQHRGCAVFLCSQCLRRCCRCGRTVCARHSTQYQDGQIYCSRCRPIKWLRLFFDIGAKENEK